jgi:hypothetical protein
LKKEKKKKDDEKGEKNTHSGDSLCWCSTRKPGSTADTTTTTTSSHILHRRTKQITKQKIYEKETRKINKESDVIRFPFERLNEREKEMKEERLSP